MWSVSLSRSQTVYFSKLVKLLHHWTADWSVLALWHCINTIFVSIQCSVADPACCATVKFWWKTLAFVHLCHVMTDRWQLKIQHQSVVWWSPRIRRMLVATVALLTGCHLAHSLSWRSFQRKRPLQTLQLPSSKIRQPNSRGWRRKIRNPAAFKRREANGKFTNQIGHMPPLQNLVACYRNRTLYCFRFCCQLLFWRIHDTRVRSTPDHIWLLRNVQKLTVKWNKTCRRLCSRDIRSLRSFPRLLAVPVSQSNLSRRHQSELSPRSQSAVCGGKQPRRKHCPLRCCSVAHRDSSWRSRLHLRWNSK